MNPQYVPQQQFGVQQPGFGPGKTAGGIQDPFSMNSGAIQQPPGGFPAQFSYGYKGGMGPSPAQSNVMPPPLKQIPPGPPQSNPPGPTPPPPTLQIHNGPAMGQMMPPPNVSEPSQVSILPPQGHSPQRQVISPPTSIASHLPSSTRIPPHQPEATPMMQQTNQMGPPPGQMSAPPTSMGHSPGQMGPPPTPLAHTSGPIGPLGSMGPPQGQMGPPQSFMGPAPSQMAPPLSSMGQQSLGQSQGQMGPPPSSMPPQSLLEPPQGQMGLPPTSISTSQSQMGPPPSSMGQMGPPGQMRQPPGQIPPQPGHMRPPQGQMGPPSGLMGPPQGQMSQIPHQMGPPQAQMSRPPLGQTNPAANMPPKPQQIMPPNHSSFGPPPSMTQGPPRPGMPPTVQAGPFMPKPSLPYQNIPPGAAPLNSGSSFAPSGVSQICNQMSDMNIGARQYPGAPMKPALNGENFQQPTMSWGAPPSVNGSQNRGPQVAGYPPAPGQQQQMPGGPYPPQPSYQQPQQARRLDPDQMPSPIQVTLDDQKTRSGIFCTNQKGLVPPLVSTNFLTQDQGNASPRYIRSTMYNVPTTSDMMKQTAVPFGLVISPLARTIQQEYAPPIVNFGELGPVRCIRCKAYMSPFMQFIDSGRRFQCLFCKATTEVPTEYFQHLDHTGQRVDRYERPELILGTYEFVATKDYCRNNTFPKAPAIIFVIDVSYNNVKAGLVHLLCAEMKEILKNLPIDQEEEKTKMKVGFITYNNTVHFYNIKGTLAQPQMLVVGDTQEMFMPLLDGFLCDVEESAAVIDSLMEQIPVMFADTRETETVLLPAIQAGLEALKASECPGKLLIFHSTLPTADSPGRLKNRDERKLLGTEKERSVLIPQNQTYNSVGQDCVQAGCSVDLFISNNSYIDIATIGQVCRLTGGEVFKYTYFQADLDGQRLINDVITDISRPIAFDSIMRVRTSTGVRPTDFYGHFFMSNTTDMEIAAIDCDKAVAVEIKHDDKLTEEEGVYIQVALLYTSCSGQRRLRIINLSLKTCSQMTELYRSCELDTIINFFSKQCVYRLLENNPKAVKDSLVNRCAQMLACYRKNCASPSSAGQLILPECMKLLPLYVNCILKSDAISGGSDITLDDRSFVMQCVTTMDIPTSVVYFYPRLIPLHELQNGTEDPEIPNPIRCTVEKMVENGIYLLENGLHMFLWIGLNSNPEWIQNVFGVSTAAQVDVDRLSLPELDNSLSVAVRNLIEKIRMQRHRCMRLTFVRQRDKLELVFRHFLVEDRGQEGSSSYVDFLCHMHKEIRQLLS